MLRNRLSRHRKTAASLYFMKKVKEKYPHLDLDHILGSNKEKLNDFLLCPMPHGINVNRTYPEGYSFEERLMTAIEILITEYENLFDELLRTKIDSE